MRVLHLPTSVGGMPWSLAQAERKLGLDSNVLLTEQNWLDYSYDICLHFENKSKFEKAIKRIKTFFEVRDKYDVFHFNFGSTLIDYFNYGIHLIDLPFYKGKKVFTYNGCDARQKYPTITRTIFSACHEDDCYGGICNSGNRDYIKKKRIEKVSKYADHIFAVNPDLLYFLPKEKSSFLPYAVASWNDIKYDGYKISNKICLVHAPTNRGAKGSKYILRALENLKNRCKNIEILIIENVPNKDAINLYKKAQIVIDQVLIGWYGGLAVEVMKMGKPVAVFIRDEDLKFIPQEMAKQLKDTIINVNPFNLEEELSKYIENTNLLIQKSQASLEYVHRWHDPKYVASITKSVYEKYL